MMKAFGIKTVDAPEIQKQLLLAEPISLEIQQARRKKKNKKESISTLLSGKILKKYQLLSYAAGKTGTNRRKLSKISGKVINLVKPNRGFERGLYTKVLGFYHRDDFGQLSLANEMQRRTKRKRYAFRREF